MAEVFISYARADEGFARDINTALQKLERDTWIDWRSIPDSTKWRGEIFAAIEAADNFLFIISPNSIRSSMCMLEVSHALANNKRIVTILYQEVDRRDLLDSLREIQWIDYPELGFEPTLQRVIKVIDTDLEWVRRHTHLLTRANKWEVNGRDSGFLLHGTELREAIRHGSIRSRETSIYSSWVLPGTVSHARPETWVQLVKLHAVRPRSPFGAS